MVQSPWQNALNPQLTQRLLRPLVCPGVIPDTLAAAIFERSRQFKQRLSLLHQFQQRWGRQSALQVPDTPIVYAQWVESTEPATTPLISPGLANQGNSQSMQVEQHTTVTQITPQQPVTEPTALASPTQPLVIQAKFANPPISSPDAEPTFPITTSSVPKVSPNAQARDRLKGSIEVERITSTTTISQISIAAPLPSRESTVRNGVLPLVVPGSVQQGQFAQRAQESEAFSEKRLQSLLEGESLLAPSFADSASSFPLLKELPLVKAQRVAAAESFSQPTGVTQPLVLARPMSSRIASGSEESSMMPSAASHQMVERSSITHAQPVPQKPAMLTPSPQPIPTINVNTLTQQVERKLMRKLTVERERRGQRSWH
ncbi:hypothetical protein [Stenomitos frigidus]|uniref:Uncharacterized protein n=1 Tax=Stenomitos frigidus ULC18 TaxID=2107698 RepID=A0A2T1ENT7_9CYAN|nr:hypothetical protein [Stenomitos frigidus]PSB34412.1 hypothetical protein C7B82_02815 [Stenomitos frigidus ULC18]